MLVIGRNNVASIAGGHITALTAVVGRRYRLHVNINIIANDLLSNQRPWALLATQLDLKIRVGNQSFDLASMIASPASVIGPRASGTDGQHERSFTIDLDERTIDAIEDMRRGGDLLLFATVYFQGFNGGQFVPSVLMEQTTFKEDSRAWTDRLTQIGYREYVHVELKLPREQGSLRRAAEHLRDALEKHARGEKPVDVVGQCRLAIESLENVGFGRRSPKDVADFIKDKGASENYSLDDRVAALKMAAELFCHPAHHPDEQRDRTTYEDAVSMLAVTAALLQLAPHRLRPPTPAE